MSKKLLGTTKKAGNFTLRRNLFFRRSALFFTDFLVYSLIYFFSWAVFFGPFHLDVNISILHWGMLGVCFAVASFLFGCYDSLWRYADAREYMMQAFAIFSGFLVYFLIDHIGIFRYTWHYSCRFAAFVAALSLILMWLIRFLYRAYRTLKSAHSRNDHAKKLVIVGAGNAGVGLLGEIENDKNAAYRVYGFFDDDPGKHGLSIHGVPVLGAITDITEKLQNTDVAEIIVAIPSAPDETQQNILHLCSKTGIRVRILPHVVSWMQAGKSDLWGQVRDVRVEDLLGRDTVKCNDPDVYTFVQGKTVLVTGGGGSIGSELCRQVAAHHPARLVILDIYENNAYDIEQELRSHYGKDLNLSVEIASVRDSAKLNLLFDRYRPQIVFHAAAHKHVPLMENCPEEAIKNNVFGTYHTAMASKRTGVEKFILISTDKAVNPTNVMGASKRLCEMIVQSLQDCTTTAFVAVRFGNVLGSNGSVIPLFKKQLEQGGPLTVTDFRIIRYFMTIPEAAQLVMRAGAMAESSQVFVLDMGRPVRILELAENLIRLSGLRPYEDIQIIETGLRPGEKLYEELLIDSDRLTSTDIDRIFVEERESISNDWMEKQLQRLQEACNANDPAGLVALMRELVPTFRAPEDVNAEAEEKMKQEIQGV